ncbi:MAG: acylphosphatase [Candidatus Zixiibacteriota bacterium]
MMTAAAVEMTVRGMVQGIGFRYWCYHRAQALGVTGWVRNNPDGSVSMAVEGDRSLLDEFIQEIKVGPRYASVTDVDIKWTEFRGQYRTFEIRM